MSLPSDNLILRTDLVFVEGRYQTVQGPRPDSALVTVFENGEIRKRWTFDEVRARAEAVFFKSVDGRHDISSTEVRGLHESAEVRCGR
jgi:hypothetical protein